MITLNKLHLILAVALTNFLLALGLFGPCFTLQPQFGEFTHAIKMFRPSFGTPQTVSVFSGIILLFREGEFSLGLLLFVFSVCFPIWKISVLWQSVLKLHPARLTEPNLKHIERSGKYSMLDVFVIAVLTLAMKGLPGGSEIHIRWGLCAFALSALLPMVLPGLIEAHRTKTLK